MKKKIFTLFTALTLSAGALFASDTAVDGIYYDFDDANQTATVTYRGSYYSSYHGEYKGNVLIPATVTYGGNTYSVTSIGYRAFYECYGLTSVTIPNSVTSIEDAAFEDCGLTSVTIPNSVTSIGSSAFYDCDGLTSVTIPNSVTSIGYRAFYECYGLTSVTIPNSVTSIGGSAFYYCSGLTSVTIGNSVTSIGEDAFLGCRGLTSVVWNAKNCAGFSKWYYNNGNSDSDAPFYYIASQITSFTFGSEVEHIPAYLCYGMENLTSVTIPNSVTNIGGDAFAECSRLTSVVWNAKNCADFNTIYAPFYHIASQITSFTFGSEVDHIPAYLCYGMENLTSVMIPNSVTSIGGSAFDGCSGLPSVTIPNSVTSIEWGAFSGCSGLTSVTIPNSVTSIGRGAFQNCSGLTSVTIPNSVTSIGSSAFNGCSGLTSVTIPNSVTSIGSSAFQLCSGLTSVTIPNSVTSIGSSAFSGCSGLTSVLWNAKNCADFSYASAAPFSDIKSQITSFTFGSEVEHIPAYLCYGMENLTSVTIPNSVTSIGCGAFDDCSGLTSVTIPNSVTSIDGYAFFGCTALHEITVLPTVPPTCGSDAFYNVPIGATLRCPCASREDYQAADTWSQFTNIIPADFPNVTLLADEEQGSVQVEDRICESKSVVISATANAGYHFVQWSNGATDATYTFILTQDTILTAEFALNQHKVTVTAGENGSVKVVLNDEETAETTFAYGTEIIITATADEGYCFVQWDDDNIDNPRTITVTEDITLSAEFAPSQTALETVTLSPVYAVDGRIVCNGEFRIYDLLGRDVTRLNGSLSGVYVVKTANAAQKVIVK